MKDKDTSSAFASGLYDDPLSSIESGFSSGNICGESKSSIVYRMRLNGLQVAVKRLRKTFISNPQYISAYSKEYIIGCRLKHDALPVYRNIRADMEDVYIVMDYIDGVSIEDFIETDEGKTRFRNIVNIKKFLTQLLNAVTYMHRSGVIHCDLKPSNVMLRHSDRAVMLIDLDKAYCDTFDLTHGGTSGISNTIDNGEKPTTTKDFAAIGRIIDIFERSIPGFPISKLSRFRRLCASEDVSEEKLYRALQFPSFWVKGGVVAASIILVSIISAAALITRENKDMDDTLMAVSSNMDVKSESGNNIEQVTINQTQSKHKPQPEFKEENIEKSKSGTTPSIVIPDIDIRMEKYQKEVEAATDTLRTGNITDIEIYNMSSRVSNLYLSTYNKMVEEYKKKYPKEIEFEVYLAIAKALNDSRTFKIMQSFNKEVMDTVNARVARIK